MESKLFFFRGSNNQLDERKEVTFGHLQPTMDESFGSSDLHKRNDLRCHKTFLNLRGPLLGGSSQLVSS